MHSVLVELVGGFGLAYAALALFLVAAPFTYLIVPVRNTQGDGEVTLKFRLALFCGLGSLLVLTGITQIVAVWLGPEVISSNPSLQKEIDRAHDAAFQQGLAFLVVGAVCWGLHDYWLRRWTNNGKFPGVEMAFLSLRALTIGLVAWGALLLGALHLTRGEGGIWTNGHISFAFVLIWLPAWFGTNSQTFRLTRVDNSSGSAPTNS